MADTTATGSAKEAEGYDVNRRLALVCVDQPDRQDAVKAALQELGYSLHLGSGPDEAAELVRKNSYEVVVLDEEFNGATPHDHALLRAIQWMPMTLRRYMFVALLGREGKTFDNMMAFAQSVNVVVNVNDLPQLRGILQKGLADNEQFYRVFRQVLQEAGKR